MTIGFDITSLIYQRGVSRYTTNVVESLLHWTPLQLSLYGSSFRQRSVLQQAVASWQQQFSSTRVSGLIQPIPPTLQELLWHRLHRNPVHTVLPNIDVFHAWDWIQPPDTSLPIVSTVHDVALLRYPETAHPTVRRMHEYSWKTLKQRKAHIIAVSHATKHDLIERLGFPAQNVHVVYEALPRETTRVSEQMSEERYAMLKQQLHLDKPFFLFVGTREPRKNLKRLIEAWYPLRSEFSLCVAGEEGWDDSEKIAKEMRAPELRFLGKVSDEELSVLYGEATALAYPSLYEGFGLPILESFYHGTPVVTSTTSAMPEVAGNAAELVNPLDVESIRTGLQKLAGESLKEQQARLQKMIIRLHIFDWQRVAEQTAAVYARAYEEFHA